MLSAVPDLVIVVQPIDEPSGYYDASERTVYVADDLRTFDERAAFLRGVAWHLLGEDRIANADDLFMLDEWANQSANLLGLLFPAKPVGTSA